MAANPRILPDSAYTNGAVAMVAGSAGTWWLTLDNAQFSLWDGDAGGTWSPASPIQIGGAGMWFCGPAFLQPPAAAVMAPITAAAPLTHGDSDFIALGVAHNMSSRFLVAEAALGKDASGCPTLQVYAAPGGGKTGGIMGQTAVMLPSGVNLSMGQPGGFAYRPGGRLQMPLRVHHGANLTSVLFNFEISSAHTGLPDVFPQFRVHKVDLFGNLTPLFSGTANGSGFIELPSPGTLAAYKTTVLYTYNCDGGTVIDTSQYSYIAEIIDESGVNAVSGNNFLAATARCTNIKDMRPQ